MFFCVGGSQRSNVDTDSLSGSGEKRMLRSRRAGTGYDVKEEVREEVREEEEVEEEVASSKRKKNKKATPKDSQEEESK